MRLKPLISLSLIFLSLTAFGDDRLNCAGLKLSPQSNLPIKTPPTVAWTEEYIVNQSSGYALADQLKAMDRILAYQNQRTMGCAETKPRVPDPLYESTRFKKNDNIYVSVAMGYDDHRPDKYVWDILLYNTLVNQMTSRCESDFDRNCGFENANPYSENDALLAKQLGNNKKLYLHIFKAALTWDDDLNRKNPAQQIASAEAENKFFHSFSDSQFVFYMGHSRNGGGADFYPPKLTASNGTDYQLYLLKKENSNKLMAEMKKIKLEDRPLLFGFLGCDSQLHFENRLKTVMPNSMLMLSKQEVFTVELYEGLMTVVNGIQLKKSKLEMNIDLEAVNIARRSVKKMETSLLFLTGPK